MLSDAPKQLKDGSEFTQLPGSRSPEPKLTDKSALSIQLPENKPESPRPQSQFNLSQLSVDQMF